MHNGVIIEKGTTQSVFDEPQQPYTQALIDAIPLPEPDPHWLD